MPLKVPHTDSLKQAELPEWERLSNERLSILFNQMSEILDIDFNSNPFRSLRLRFVLAHAPRVGSHLLCEHLRGYGVLVREYFELQHIDRMARRNGFTAVEEFCEWLLNNFALEGIFGVSGGVRVLAPMMAAGEIPEFITDWRFVHLTRDDFVARAVSELIARLTTAFTSAKKPAMVLGDDDYDGEKLRKMIDTTQMTNGAWEGAFKVYGINPYRLTYEALCADTAGEAAKVASFLQLKPSQKKDWRLAPPKLEKQGTNLNERWVDRFRAENEEFCKAQADRVFQ